MLTLTRTPLSLVTNTHYAMGGGDDAAGASTSNNKKASKKQIGQQQKRRSARNVDKENGDNGVNGGDVDDEFAFRSKTTTKLSSMSRARGIAESINEDEHEGSATERPSVVTGNKRKQAYDEDDDGFTFTRVKNKKSKTSSSLVVNAEPVATSKVTRAKATRSAKVPPPVAEEDSMVEPEPGPDLEPLTKQQSEPERRRGRKRGLETEAAAEQQDSDPVTSSDKPTRRKPGRPAKNLPRSPGDDAEEVPPLQVEKKRARQKSPVAPLAATRQPSPRQQRRRQPQTQDQEKIAPEAEIRPAQRTKTPPVAGTTKIALPFADTPIIRRNQEMRRRASGVGHSSSSSERDGRGSRRSSLGQRGRRASSLIDSGRSSALPHDAVDTAEFFKHIEADLPEPRRMRQLLTWCGTRALGDRRAAAARDDLQKDGGKANGKKLRNDGQEAVRLAAREIQSQVLKDFGLRTDMSNWFSRPDDEAELGRETVLKKPNPRNEANEKKIKELEAQLARLQAERTTWETLLQPAIAASPTSRPKKNASQPSDALELAPILPAPKFTLHRKSTLSNSSAFSTTSTTNISSSPAKCNTYSTSTSSTHVPAFDVDLLTQSNAAIASSVRSLKLRTYPILQEDVRRRLDTATQALEFDSDRLAAGVHALAQYRGVAGRVAGFVLDRAAEALEVRSRRERSRSAAAIGSSAGSDGEGSRIDEEERGERPLRDVLRGLSRLENR